MLSSAQRSHSIMFLYSVTVFVSAFLLFQVQPLIAKMILPWFGGTPAVWTSSLLFFQVFLLIGYAYAHASIQKLTTKWQVIVHSCLLFLALIQLPIAPSARWIPTIDDEPTWHIILLLTFSLGLPYVVLAASAPLLQAWFSQQLVGRSPYRLYALSNAGSLLALLSYPFVIEPIFELNTQSNFWSGGFVFFALLCGSIVLLLWQRTESKTEGVHTPEAYQNKPAWHQQAWWLVLPALAVIVLLSVTNQSTQDIAVVPFFWVLPLSLYLLTFIIAFDSPRWYVRSVFLALLIPTTILVLRMLTLSVDASIDLQIGGYAIVVFMYCMFLHGELSRLRPSPSYLTSYYLTIALGGALGGIFVAVIAPVIFSGFFELHLVIWLVCFVAVIRLFSDDVAPFLLSGWGKKVVVVVASLVIVSIGGVLADNALSADEGVLTTERNFYGITQVTEEALYDIPAIWFTDGGIIHGMQYQSAGLNDWPTTYFGENSGVGLAILNYPRDGAIKMGVLGLGVGTLAAYGQESDVIRFYEINPRVRDIAETYFTYLSDSPADVSIIMGDARLSLEQEPPQGYDILVLDAFSSDAVPLHLLTIEAFEIYVSHLKPDGIIAINITNRHINLQSPMQAIANEFGFTVVHIYTGDERGTVWSSEWLLLSKNELFLEAAPILEYALLTEIDTDGVRLWTDQYSSLFPYLYLELPVGFE